MKESDLYGPVRDWLLKRGYTIHVEIFDADIVATKPDPTCHRGVKVVAVELKACLSTELVSQMRKRSQWADEVWGAIASAPRSTTEATHEGYGVLRVEGSKVRQLKKAKAQPYFRTKMRDYRLKKLVNVGPAQSHEVAGLPSCRALREQRDRRTSQEQTQGWWNVIRGISNDKPATEHAQPTRRMPERRLVGAPTPS